MTNMNYQADLDKTLDFFKGMLAHYEPKALEFIEEKDEQIFKHKSDLTFYMTFSSLPQYIENDKPVLSASELHDAASLRKNLDLSHWYSSQIARVYLLLLMAKNRPEDFKEIIDKIISAADVVELIALYQAFPLFPNPEKFLLHATNGIRCNMISVFNGIALNNPYPADFFNETAWNQLVLKTLFVDSPIERVSGLKQRANLTLAHALLNTVRERCAASRPVKPELWYLIGLAADEDLLKVLEGFLDTNNPVFQEGALLACKQNRLPLAQEIQQRHADKYKQSNIQEALLWARQFDNSLINQQ